MATTNPKKTPWWLSILILTGLGISVSPHQFLTRTAEVSRALSPVLSNYEVIRMAPGEIERQVRTTGELRFRFDETDFYFNLEPHDMRAPGYRAVETGPGGVRRTLPTQPVHTLKGVLAGREDTRGRFNLTDGGVEGVVYAPEGWVYVEPLRNYLPNARAGELVVYSHADIKPGEPLTCGVSLPKRLRRGVDRVMAQVDASSSTNPTKYEFDIATEADYEYVQALGGSENANREIEGILNQVEGVYESELLLQLRISYQNTWGMADDPYTATNSGDLLGEFREYWNTHYSAEIDYDIAHLWTDRERDDRTIVGLAWTGVVCRSRASSYSLSNHQSSIPRKYTTPAHEIGHNFGAVHPNDQDPPIAGCNNTVMTTSVVPGGDSPELTFCQYSRQEITEYVSGDNSCLIIQPITLQPPAALVAVATSKSSITLNWQDRSTNETGFIVQRRRDGSGHWIEVGRTDVNVTTLLNGGLFSDSAYIYRVQAFNDHEFSAFSNEAAATTPTGQLPTSDWRIYSVAGDGVYNGDTGPANQAVLSFPGGMAVDSSGNLYIADTNHDRIRRVDVTGNITTVAGIGERGYSGDGGPAVEARLNSPSGITVDSAGNLYIADTGNDRIRRVDVTGNITTVAGTGERGHRGDGGPAVEARLNSPSDVTVDGSGSLYVADTENHRIRRMDSLGTLTTVAGTGKRGYSGDGGPAVEARLNKPRGMAMDNAGNLYIADIFNQRIRRVDTRGTIITVAGIGGSGLFNHGGYSGDGGPAVEAQLDNPIGVAVDGAGHLYIADYANDRIRRVNSMGIISTVAGIGENGYSGDGGAAVDARLDSPRRLVVDSAGNLYIADSWNHRIRRVDVTGTITTIAGIGKRDGAFSGDGRPGIDAELNNPQGVAVDGSGNLYIADTQNHRIRRVDASGLITTIAGTGEIVRLNRFVDGAEGGYSGDNGPAIEAGINHPERVAVDRSGNLYFADTWNHRIRRVDTSGIITTIVGTGPVGYSGGSYRGDGGPAIEARLSHPRGIVVDDAGNLFIADSSNHCVRRVDTTGTITTFAGMGNFNSDYSGDGGPAVKAELSYPTDVALDSAGNLYIADSGNERIRRVDSAGIITTIAGSGEGLTNRGHGPAVEAILRRPFGIAVDSVGNLYIAETYNHRIDQVNPSGILTTIVGTGEAGYSGDGGPGSEARLYEPVGLAVDITGNLFVADSKNHRIRVLTRPPEAPTRLTATAVSSSRIKLAWQDNSNNEQGFRIQRRVAGAVDWIEIGTVTTNLTRFLDEGLEPHTTYHYRVRAFNYNLDSAISNEARATTLAVMPLTLTGFTPKRGPVGARVTLAGTKLFEATAVEFNGVNAPDFEILSGTSIEIIVPPEATSGPISVMAPGGTAVSADPFTVTTGVRSRLFLPIVLRAQGRTPGSFFTSELTLTNRGTTTAIINYTYSAAIGTGSGTAVDSLAPGRQRVIPDAIDYLTSLGVPIGSGSAGGTLAVDFSNLSSPSDAAVTVRVSTPVEEGRAGLAFPGLYPDGLLTGPAFITGLRQNRQDRSNLAVQNAGDAGEQSVTLRVTVYSGDPASAVKSLVLPDLLTLDPGGFHQYNGILTEAGFDNGYVKVERVEGAAPYYVYGVINDNFNSDGSFVFPVREDSLEGSSGQTLPVIIETKDFASELTVTNFSAAPKTVDFRFVAEAVETDGDTARFSLELEAGEQRILPRVVDWMRQQEVEGIGAVGEAFVGAVFATVAEGDMSGIVMGARTGSPDARGGQYSLFYNGVTNGTASMMSAWIYGLQQNEENRSNLALINTGEVDDSEIVLEIDIYDGEGDSEPRTRSVTLRPRRWHQFNGILGNRGQGYVEVRKTMGNNPFITYGVINDGAKRGQRSGDGAFILSQP